MNTRAAAPTPAIVTQEAVRRLPRWALVLLCIVYVLAGFVGREPWKAADISAYGVMLELASGNADWLDPRWYEQAVQGQGLLPYWLGAWAIQIAPNWVQPDVAARIPFGLLLGLSLIATWYGTYYLARLPAAQPVPFAFGGEANPVDYGRSMADGALLALLAMLGLAQLSHETTPSVVQLAFSALLFFAVAASWVRLWMPGVMLLVATVGLALSGAPAFGLALCCAAALVRVIARLTAAPVQKETQWDSPDRFAWGSAAWILVCGLAAAGLAWSLGQWWARMGEVPAQWSEWRKLARLVIWFTWPAWPLAVLALWRWRRQWLSLHIAWPLAALIVMAVATLIRPGADRTLFLALPALACLAAMALPTLHRSVSALVDWFTVLFFTGCGIVLWVVYLSMHTGFPAKPAQNVARLLPGFEVQFNWIALIAALLATAVWIGVVVWRVGRHRSALWKSLVLPATGAVMSWVLLSTLWMPILNQSRSYAPTVARVHSFLVLQGWQHGDCVSGMRLTIAQQVALRIHSPLKLNLNANTCKWMLADAERLRGVELQDWRGLQAFRRRGSADAETLVVFQRVKP